MQGFKSLSIREQKGKELIKDLINKDVPVVIDPTLLLDGEYWEDLINPLSLEPYILFYFLSEPSKETIVKLKEIENYLDKKVVVIPSISDWHSELYKVETIPTGPLEFISLIKNADFVCTDSFHGMAYSINLNIPFLVFKRNYGKASDQSSRVLSLLNILSLGDRFVNDVELNLKKIMDVDFVESNKMLSEQREKGL